MNFEKRYRNSSIFFGISFLFLLVFLGVWLQNVYQDKVEELETEVSFLWLKSIQNVESEKLSKLVLPFVSTLIDSSSHSPAKKIQFKSNLKKTLEKSFGKPFPPSNNTSNHKIILNGQMYDSEVEIIIEQDSSLDSTQSVLYSKDIFTSRDAEIINIAEGVDVDLSALKSASTSTSFQHLKFLELFYLDTNRVRTKLDQALLEAQLPVRYKIYFINDSLSDHSFVEDRFFTKTAADKKYSLELESMPSIILHRMWFEFLMALLLIFVITATLYYTLHNLKEQNRLVTIKNDLISNITHELRTPIFTVSAALEALESFNGLENPERTKEYLNISKNELNRLSILVEKVLKTSLFEQDALKINYEVFPIAPLLENISNSLQLQLEQENALLEISIPDPLIQVRADKIHLTNVVYNLIDNALKYKSECPTKIQIEVINKETQLQIMVSDNGIGIPKEYLSQIFNKFFRVPKGDQHNVKGYGLGLNYVSNIIQQHQGTVTVTSIEGEGSQFIISLPKQ